MAPIELHRAGISPNLSQLGPALAELDHIAPRSASGGRLRRVKTINPRQSAVATAE